MICRPHIMLTIVLFLGEPLHYCLLVKVRILSMDPVQRVIAFTNGIKRCPALVPARL